MSLYQFGKKEKLQHKRATAKSGTCIHARIFLIGKCVAADCAYCTWAGYEGKLFMLFFSKCELDGSKKGSLIISLKNILEGSKEDQFDVFFWNKIFLLSALLLFM